MGGAVGLLNTSPGTVDPASAAGDLMLTLLCCPRNRLGMRE